eukprot:746753-Alexandrium_andersonii.AAC.1
MSPVTDVPACCPLSRARPYSAPRRYLLVAKLFYRCAEMRGRNVPPPAALLPKPRRPRAALLHCGVRCASGRPA